MPHRCELIANPEEALRQPVYAALQAFNRQQNPQFYAERELPENEVRPLDLLAYNNDGHVIGGLFGETQFLWLKIHIMAVQEAFRGQGVGRELMRLAEEEAIRRGCRYAFVDTMDYQAPRFYERLGYGVACRLENWDSHAHAKFYLTKQLAE